MSTARMQQAKKKVLSKGTVSDDDYPSLPPTSPVDSDSGNDGRSACRSRSPRGRPVPSGAGLALALPAGNGVPMPVAPAGHSDHVHGVNSAIGNNQAMTAPDAIAALFPGSPVQHHTPIEPSGPNDDAAVVEAQLTEAKRLIREYALPGGKQWLTPNLVGFDPSNRDGVPMTGERCEELLSDIAEMGYDPEEANFGNICVQERPNKQAIGSYPGRCAI